VADPTPTERNRIQPLPPVSLPDRERAVPSLPVPLTSFVGREREVAAVVALLRRPGVSSGSRLVTLTGPGGVGKTRLAIRVAEEAPADFPDGTWFVALAPILASALVAPTIARVLNVRETIERPIEDGIRDFLRDRRTLLILDNFEHVLDAGPLVAGLLSTCPALSVLVTSRSVLHLSGEHTFDVPPLALRPLDHAPVGDPAAPADALRLFADRASAVGTSFALTDASAPTVAAICAKLDGLPLAIELAAARLRALPLPALLAHLEHRLPLLGGGARDQPARLRTMRDAIAWSYDLLEPDEQALFRALSVFVGGFTLEAAEAVCGRSTDGVLPGSRQTTGEEVTVDRPLSSVDSVLDGIVSLVDKSLVRAEEAPDSGVRYQMLETIREFGLERLAAASERERALNAHAAYFTTFVEPEHSGPQGGGWYRVEADFANLRAALTWRKETGDAEGVLRLAGAMGNHWQVSGQHREALQWLEWGLAHAPDRPTLVRGWALRTAGLIVWSQGHYDQAEPFARSCLAIATELGSKELEMAAFNLFGLIAEVQFRWEEADRTLHQALDLAREIGVHVTEAVLLFLLSGVALGLGDSATATRRAEQSVAILRGSDYPHSTATALGYLGLATLDRGDDPAATGFYREALDLWAGVTDRWWIVKALAGLAAIAGLHGQPEAAAALVGGIDAVLAAVGIPIFPYDRITYLIGAASAETALGREPFDALRAAGRARSLAETIAIASRVTGPAVGGNGSIPAVDVSQGKPSQGRVSAVLPLIIEGRSDREIIDLLKRKAPPAAAAGPAAPHGLSPRELEVLRLLADGQTDREIADSLFISPRTVGVHIARILGKLDLPTRAAAVAFAHRHGLA